MHRSIWPICITVMVLGLFYTIEQTDRSSREAEAKIGVACAESGGSWLKDWRGPYCERGSK